MKLFIITLVLGLLLFVSCNNETQLNETDENILEITEDIIVDKEELGGVSFKNEIQPLLDHDCISCHEYLESGVSYEMLTTNNSTSVGSSKYIDIENPEESYFYIKLKAEPPCGSSMGGQWTEEEIAIVLKWIEEGAKNN